MDENIRNLFNKEPTVETLNREDLISALIKRHQDTLSPLKGELKEMNKRREELEKQRNTSRKDRDGVNSEVMELKQVRQVLHGLANEKRREFFVLMEKLDDMEKIDQEVDKYSSQLDKMEWEIQTTRITATDEKVMIKRMKEIYEKLTEANQEAQLKLGIKEQIATLSKEIGDNLHGAQDRHEKLLDKAKESDTFHDTFIEAGKELSELRIAIRRTERRIHTHRECLEYWKSWTGGKRSGPKEKSHEKPVPKQEKVADQNKGKRSKKKKKEKKVNEKKTENVDDKKTKKAEKKKAEKVEDKKAEKAVEEKAKKVEDKKAEKAEKKKAEKVEDKKAEKAVEEKAKKVEDKKAEKAVEKMAKKVEDKKVEKAVDRKAKKVEDKRTEKESDTRSKDKESDKDGEKREVKPPSPDAPETSEPKDGDDHV